VTGTIDLTVERPAAGGRMIARHEGRIVFVAGAVPGERVRAVVERDSRQAIKARVVEIVHPSPDRRESPVDPACGGMAYGHIRYERQLTLKAEVIADAFRRLGRLALPAPLVVAPSPERGYRLRARFHVAGGRAVFFREGTHRPCEARGTGQVSEEAFDAVERLGWAMGEGISSVQALLLAENVTASERVIHIEPHAGAPFSGAVALPEGLTGLTSEGRGRPICLAGTPTVTDTAGTLFGAEPPIDAGVSWTRHATSFFQGNRFLTGALVRRVLEAAAGARAVDLYAGVGLFAVALAARGAEVAAVEGDRSAAADLEANARPWADRLLVIRRAVESVVGTAPDPRPDVVVLDPPRTGMSRDALQGVAAWHAPRLVYVSCDPPTLARDAARLVEAGYVLAAVDAFDLFPNTPHVETVAVFDRPTSATAPGSPSGRARA
jgi:23S rRNA (uracil1939-C5)-methyltransferase